MSGNQLVWFRTDLRIHDHAALSRAAARGPCIAVCTLTPSQWREHGHGDNKLSFWYRGIEALSTDLKSLRIPLKLIYADTYDNCPKALLELAQSLECTDLHFSNQYGVNERTRDEAVTTLFQDNDLNVHRDDANLVMAPGSLTTNDDAYYKVFTPFYKAWLKAVGDDELSLYDTPSRQAPIKGVESDTLEMPKLESAIDESQWPAGTEEAENRLEYFLRYRVRHYDDKRDFPYASSTSTLSAYLALGMISPRQCIAAAMGRNDNRLGDGDASIVSWISELVWREFYQHVLVGFPRVSMHQPFQEQTKKFKWRQSTKDFDAWCAGETGYPLVDAAMKQLIKTGWMHNRLRMVTAMFLTKHLLIDWRWGERFFLEHLVDGELGANNGGWQWSASTGTDASPYFRIFNPTTQSERFDPEGHFIVQYLPCLEPLAKKHRHAPRKEQRKECGYPEPIVDHKAARERALDAFKAL
ncbi:deoxyribodipyrimidine photo-lyase [Larsenimonas suaedae]|uniref:Deoxyribodipyrimidine photo-lyase n=1 Tax=Larsenimonas suaedae TaxID=1851019 RepID=A0ABU1H0L3_9GAMM|nr:deoxyribodipyrimidine photo-lyase [Larsenimonas suaedae]MCM2973674.1 deoxyribodipyrimidine photo-lyase [Larsenimonas suaedae]MDR5897192.1 deoxyribodipyrimidine photo-lyase [Larsenimonas suaedae]